MSADLDESVIGLELPVMVECAVAHALTLSDARVFAVCAGTRRAMPVLSGEARERIADSIDVALHDGRVTEPSDVEQWAETAWDLRAFDDRGVTA